MEEASDLMPPTVTDEVLQRLRNLRRAKAHGFVRINVEHGYICGVGGGDNKKYPFEDRGEKPRNRSKT